MSTVVNGDYRHASTHSEIAKSCKKFDLILADTYPFSKIAKIDIEMGQGQLTEDILPILKKFLSPGGSFIVKMPVSPPQTLTFKKCFKTVEIFKPAKKISDSYYICSKFYSANNWQYHWETSSARSEKRLILNTKH